MNLQTRNTNKKKIIILSCLEVGGHPIRLANFFSKYCEIFYINFMNPIKKFLRLDLDSSKFHNYESEGVKIIYLPILGNSNFSFLSSLILWCVYFVFNRPYIISYGAYNSHIFINPDVYISYGSDLYPITKKLNKTNKSFFSKISNLIAKKKITKIFEFSKKIVIDPSFFQNLNIKKINFDEKVFFLPHLNLLEEEKYHKYKSNNKDIKIIILSRINMKPDGIFDDKGSLEIFQGINKFAKKTNRKITLAIRENKLNKNDEINLDKKINLIRFKDMRRDEYKKYIKKFDIAIDTLGFQVLNYSVLEALRLGIPSLTNYNPSYYSHLYNPPLLLCNSSESLSNYLSKMVSNKEFKLLQNRKIADWNKKIINKKNELEKQWLEILK